MNSRNLLRIAIAATSVAWAVTSGCATTTSRPTASAAVNVPPDAREVAAIRDVIRSYETALNANAIDEVLGLYGSEPVFMPQHAPALVGRDAVRVGYQQVFETLDLDIRFEVHEVQQAGEWAWARTTSAGRTRILATGTEVAEGNNELFVFRHENGAWKIHRYLFATDRPRV